jgi:hypothetical protein
MPEVKIEANANLFRVILYFQNKSWTFSTCAYSTDSQAAVEIAEKEFSVHALHHKLGNMRIDSACVLDTLDDHYFSKQNGRWRFESDRLGPYSAAQF